MGRQIKRVPFDFDHPLYEVWPGYEFPPNLTDEDEDNFSPADPPDGPGYQVWENVSDGSPVSPVFETEDALAEWLIDQGYSPGGVKAFIEFGYSPSMGFIGGTFYNEIDCLDPLINGGKGSAAKTPSPADAWAEAILNAETAYGDDPAMADLLAVLPALTLDLDSPDPVFDALKVYHSGKDYGLSVETKRLKPDGEPLALILTPAPDHDKPGYIRLGANAAQSLTNTAARLDAISVPVTWSIVVRVADCSWERLYSVFRGLVGLAYDLIALEEKGAA